MLSLFLPIWIAGALLGTLCAPVGALLLWNRSTTLAEGLGHAALLGYALHYYTGWSQLTCLLLTTLLLCLLVTGLQGENEIAPQEGLLHGLCAGALSLGLIGLYLSPMGAQQLEHALLGNMLSLTFEDVWRLVLWSAGLLAIIAYYFQGFISVLTQPELASLEGRPVRRLQALLLVVLGLSISIALRYFGALLVTVLFTTPAAIAHRWSRSPEQSVLLSIPISLGLIGVGLGASTYVDIPSSAAIGFISAVCLVGLNALPKRRKLGSREDSMPTEDALSR